MLVIRALSGSSLEAQNGTLHMSEMLASLPSCGDVLSETKLTTFKCAGPIKRYDSASDGADCPAMLAKLMTSGIRDHGKSSECHGQNYGRTTVWSRPEVN